MKKNEMKTNGNVLFMRGASMENVSDHFPVWNTVRVRKSCGLQNWIVLQFRQLSGTSLIPVTEYFDKSRSLG